jgi:hypothetical protein
MLRRSKIRDPDARAADVSARTAAKERKLLGAYA